MNHQQRKDKCDFKKLKLKFRREIVYFMTFLRICDQNNNFWFERSWRRNTILCVELVLFDDVFVCIFVVENGEMERIINSQMRTVRENRFRT